MHTLLTRWMVDLLLQMVPDCHDDQEPPLPPTSEFSVLKDVSLQKLENDAKNLSQKLNYFSKYITRYCQSSQKNQGTSGSANDNVFLKLSKNIP